jgi:signal transduction histidine kinase
MQLVGFLNKRREGALRRTLSHLGSPDAYSIQLLVFFVYTLVVISFLTDGVLLQSFNPLWILVSGAGFIPPIAIGLVYKLLFLNRVQLKSRPFWNLAVAGLAGSSRNLSVGLFAMWAGLDNSQLWLFRFFGGMVVGVAIFSIWSLSQAATTAYTTSLRNYAALQSELSATREEMPELLSGVNEKLQIRAQKSVLPQLDAIAKALGQTRSGEVALGQLRSTMANEIRPLMDEIANEAPKPFPKRNIEQLRKVRATLPSRYKLYDSISIVGAAFTQSIGFGFWLTFFFADKGLVITAIEIGIYGISLWAFKQLVPRDREFKKSTATFLTILMGAAASGLTAIYLATLEMTPLIYWVLTGISLFSGILAPVILAHTKARTERQREIESKIADELKIIAKENSIFAQRVWVFRKRWLLLLHGTVQSALTAASTRLQTAQEIDEFTIQMVKQDLHRAESAINSSNTDTLNFDESIQELKLVWNGICDVTVQVSERAKRALQRNSDAAFCVNEIAKEAISNAVRHGSASTATIEIDRIEDDLIQIEVVNDGLASRPKERKGIGSSMLDEICLSWSLTNKSKLVYLSAELPIQL